MKTFLEFTEPTLIVPKGTLSIERSEMPQIASADMPEFIDFLRANGVKVNRTFLPVNKLLATQAHVNLEKIKKLMTAEIAQLKKPVLVSQDMHLADGHHRWGALLNIDSSETIDAYWVQVPILELLAWAKRFPKAFYKDINESFLGSDKAQLGYARVGANLGKY